MIVMRAGVPKLRIDELAFTPDGAALVAPAGAAGLCFWPSIGGAKAEVLSLPARVIKRVAFVPGSRVLIAGNDELGTFDLASRTGTRIDVPKWASLSFGVSPDGTRLVVAETPQNTDGSRLTLWDTHALERPAREVMIPAVVWGPPLFPPSGDRVLLLEGLLLPSRQWEYRFVTRSLANGDVLARSEPFPEAPDQVVVSPDGQTVACRLRGSILFYPLAGGWNDVPRIVNAGKQHYTGIAYHPSGSYLGVTSNDTQVGLYDTATRQIVQSFTWGIGRMRSIAFSPDGALAAAGSNTGKVVAWDIEP